jgi:hypothetical protein
MFWALGFLFEYIAVKGLLKDASLYNRVMVCRVNFVSSARLGRLQGRVDHVRLRFPL